MAGMGFIVHHPIWLVGVWGDGGFYYLIWTIIPIIVGVYVGGLNEMVSSGI
jgi:hypothetical protein